MMGSTFRHNDYLGLAVRLFVGFVFIYAAVDKIYHPDQFARIIYNYHLLPGSLINLTALILPWVEIICGIFLIIGFYRQGAVMLINLMVIIFIAAITISVARGIDLECGCFTVSSRAKSDALGLLYRDIGLLVLTVYLYINRSFKYSLQKD